MIDDEHHTGPSDVSHTLTDAMEDAGVHPAYVHAVRTCGFVYTEENAHTLTAEQVRRWDAALDGWFVDHPEADPA
jgi:hypothetical protein